MGCNSLRIHVLSMAKIGKKVNNSEVSEDKTGLQGICGSAEGPIISTVIISL
jgi:hypothetical protein